MKVIPSILTNNPIEAKELMQKCEGVVDRVSIDIIDGKYANNKTIDPLVIGDFGASVNLDFQLMVNEPINWVQKCISAGGDRIIGHIEQMSNQSEYINRIQNLGYCAGLGLNLNTDVSKIDETLLFRLDVILLMSVPAGFGGQKFNYETIKKIEKLNKIRKEGQFKFNIHVDGGVTSDNIKDIKKAGADEVSVGRKLFKGDLKENIEMLLKY